MPKIYFIYYDQGITDKKIAERVLKIGDHVQPDPEKNFFLVKSDLTAMEIYDGFTSGLDVSFRVLVGEIEPTNVFGLWTEALWKFFGFETADNNKEEEKQEESTDDSTKD
jgi:hypothetical protein